MVGGLVKAGVYACKDGYEVVELKRDQILISGHARTESPDGEISLRPVVKAALGAPKWIDWAIDTHPWMEWEPKGHESTLSPYKYPWIVPNSEEFELLDPNEISSGSFLEFAEINLPSIEALQRDNNLSPDDFDMRLSLEPALRFANRFGVDFRPFGVEFGVFHEPLAEFQKVANVQVIGWHVTYFRHAQLLWIKAIESGDFSEISSALAKQDIINFLEVEITASRDVRQPPLMSLKPVGLMGALWFQFAQAVSTNQKLQRCRVCPTWFSYGTGTGRRRSAQYCSDKCRQASHRASLGKKKNG